MFEIADVIMQYGRQYIESHGETMLPSHWRVWMVSYTSTVLSLEVALIPRESGVPQTLGI